MSSLSPELATELARSSIKKLIKNYNASNGTDKAGLTMLFEQLARTPLFLALSREKKENGLNVVTLATNGTVFIPIFTTPEDCGRLADSAEIVCMQPREYLELLAASGHHAVINPFGDYFLIWPELVKDMLIPFLNSTEEKQRQKEILDSLPKS